MTFEAMGNAALDYLPCRYGASKLLFRGPQRDLSNPYVAFLGGSQTYGKFVERPFVTLLDQEIGPSCVNFGCMNAGIDVFVNDQSLIEVAQGARVTVLQVPTAQNMSNRLYTVHPRRNDRFVSATQMLKTIFPDIDFAGFHFNRHLLSHMRALSAERYHILEQELAAAWCARMQMLVNKIGGTVVLVWISERSPDDPDAFEIDPMHVTRAMLDEIVPHVSQFVEITLPRS
ncbi:MAG: DUF6473 family protein, partial [Paracoccaceae bacterium]